MKLYKCLKHAFNMVVNSKLRSWLTILGIIIGVAAVIAITSLGTGMQQSLSSQLGDLGGDLLTLTPGYSSGVHMHGPGRERDKGSSSATEEEVVIDKTDLQALKGISDLALIDTQITGNVDVSYLGKSGSVRLTGVDQKVWSQMTSVDLAEGRFLDSADQNVIVIGGKLANTYFDQQLGVNKMITIGGSSFRIVGIIDDTSTNIYMPISMAYQMLDDKEVGVYDSIVIKVKNEDELDSIIEKIESKLMMVRHVTAKTRDFTITSSKAMQETRAAMLSSMSLFLTAIAAVSLLVGVVGIANTMFTSVLEKTKEIGIMKAIGARNKDVLLIFLFNAGLIGLVGGILGVIFGIMISGSMSSLINLPMSRGGAITLVTWNSVLIALSASVVAGMLAGFIPAYNGSKLKPVDALRYE